MKTKECDIKALQDEMQEKYNQVAAFIKKKPVESAAIALGVGYILGRSYQRVKDMFR